MQLIRNNRRRNHRALLQQLITESETSVLCSGWIKYAGLKHLLDSIDAALLNKARITVYSNKQHTEEKVTIALEARPGVRHFIANDAHRYLHSKIYYFESGTQYTALIGSGNITEGGLVSNEELSVSLNGTIGDPTQVQIHEYLRSLEAVLRE